MCRKLRCEDVVFSSRAAVRRNGRSGFEKAFIAVDPEIAGRSVLLATGTIAPDELEQCQHGAITLLA
jgi:hypothetical protein